MSKFNRCEICGGVTSCPADDYAAVREPTDHEVQWLRTSDPEALPGWRATHARARGLMFVRERGEDGMRLVLVGSAQAGRVHAHYGIRPRWVGRCSYAFYAHRAGD